VPNGLGLSWTRDDLFKAQGNKQYVPFTVTIDSPKTPDLLTEPLDVYWRVVLRTVGTAGVTPGDAADSKRHAAFAYEDITPVTGVNTGAPVRISRSFTVPPGSYDVLVVVRESGRSPQPPRASVIKRTVRVPDLWNGELQTSSIIFAERIVPLAVPLTAEQRVARPYAFDSVEIVPSMRTRFSKREELSPFLQIYNARTDADNKPDVAVLFNFYARPAGGPEKFFNSTAATNLNARTLPKEFSLAGTRQLQTGQAVQLATFPEGEYRLEIKVTDNLSKRSLTRETSFSVSGS
jgi:hypothetical protein